jgi:hypothetical protein
VSGHASFGKSSVSPHRQSCNPKEATFKASEYVPDKKTRSPFVAARICLKNDELSLIDEINSENKVVRDRVHDDHT